MGAHLIIYVSYFYIYIYNIDMVIDLVSWERPGAGVDPVVCIYQWSVFR